MTSGALLAAVNVGLAAPRFTDLRELKPIHGDVAAGATKATVCLSCHGADGISAAPTFPRLAGQRIDYLYHRLYSFRHSDPKDPYYSASPMTALVATLSDTDLRDLAAFFASQTPKVPDPPAPAPAAAPATGTAAPPAPAAGEGNSGETLYLAGDPARGIPPCQGCHGADANGAPVASPQYLAYPALRGQYALYVTARLTNYRAGHPADTSNAMIMLGVAHTLDDPAIEAVAAWLSSLDPAKSL
jgi:cytochrome c553